MNQRLGILFYIALVALAANQVMGQKQTAPAQPSSPQKSAPPKERSMRDIVMMPVVYRVPGMDQVKVKSDLKYSNVDSPYLLLDVYAPPHLAKGKKLPAVLFIHGGAGAETRPKDWGVYKSWGRLVAASGMVGVTFTHRLGYPKPLLADASSDVNAALNYIRANADSLNIDKDRICFGRLFCRRSNVEHRHAR